MNQLRSVNNDTQTVSARELHETLGIKKRFSEWFTTNSNGFIENDDFSRVYLKVQANRYGGEQELQDYQLSVDMAKHICLMSRTEKGKQCRQYLIDLEKAWNTPEQIFARALKMADERIHSLSIDVERMRPKEIFADAVSASKSTILIRELAKLLKQNGINTGEKRLYTWLRENKFLVKAKGDDYNTPTQKAMDLGLFVVKEMVLTNSDGYERIRRTTKVTGKGQQYFINKFLSEM